MNLQYLDLQTFIKDRSPDPLVAKKALSIALGVATSRVLPLPSATVDNCDQEYAFNGKTVAAETINGFNEKLVLDYDMAMEAARSFWLVRYGTAYPTLTTPVMPDGEFGIVAKLSGVCRFINPEINTFCEQNSELVIVLVNRITRLITNAEG